MKKIIRLTEADLTRIVRRVITENKIDEMMDVSSDSDYYNQRRSETSLPQDDLSVLISTATNWCREKMGSELGTMSGSELEERKGDNDCYNVELLKRKYYR